jgi:tetratricopeptide (TPR) repeat protein
MKRPDDRAGRNLGAIDAALRRATIALQSGLRDEANRIANDLIAKYPKHAGAQQLLGMTLLAQDRAREAVAPLEAAARERPGAVVETYLAAALRRTGRSADAIAALQRAIERDEVPLVAFYELGTLLYEQRRVTEAEAILRRGIELAPGAGEFSLALGTIFLDRGDLDSAESAFARVLASAPGQTAALHGLGSALMARREFARALERFRQAIARDPSDTRAHLLLASCLFELGRPEEAIAHLRTLVSATPKLLGTALKACVECSRGRLWLRPSAAAAVLGAKPNG